VTAWACLTLHVLLTQQEQIFPVTLSDGRNHCKMLLECSFQCIDFSNASISKSADYTIQHDDYLVCSLHLGIVFIDRSK
jgi:hypothetical protein